MDDTKDIRSKLASYWDKYEKGKLSAGESRVHIGFARAIFDSLKVEIAMEHLRRQSGSQVPPVRLGPKPMRVINGRKAA